MDQCILFLQTYSSYVDFSGAVDTANGSIQFRVVSFDGRGYMGGVVKSQWYSEYQLIGGNYIEMMITEKVWREEMAAARVLFKFSQTPSCSLILSYNSHLGIERHVDFVMDRSRGLLLDRLAFDHPYTLRLRSTGALATAYSSCEFRTATCLEMTNNPALCAPPPVTDISWAWESGEERNRVVLSWIYGSPTQIVENESRVGRRDPLIPIQTAFPRIVHFDIVINPLVTISQYGCQFLDGQRRVVTGTHRSVVVYVPNENCNYGIEITVVDSRNRRSVTTKTEVIRYEQKYHMFLPPDGWNSSVVVLSVVVLVSFLTFSFGLVACRIHDRREWNTIKKSFSRQSPGLTMSRTSPSTVAHADKYAASERYPMHAVNMIRLEPFFEDSKSPVDSSSKENSASEKSDSDHSLITGSEADDVGYDTVGTPRLMESLCGTETCIGHALTASIITSLSTVNPNTLSVPHQCLIMSGRVIRSALSLWSTKHAVWTDSEQIFAIKYSHKGIGHLRREFKILNHVSTDHTNLVRWLGVGVCSGQVLSLLFEPCNGGTLSRFLNNTRKSLSHSSTTDGPFHEYQVHLLAYHLHRFASNIAEALVYLHDQHCLHLHVTCENVYLALDYCDPLEIPHDQYVKVGDFCWATVPHVKCDRVLSPQTILPPEVLIHDNGYTMAVDVWQFGLLLATIVTLNSTKSTLCLPSHVFTDRLIKHYYTCLSSGIHRFDPYMSSLKSKILMCLSLKAQNRATMKKIESEITLLNFPAPVSLAGPSSLLV